MKDFEVCKDAIEPLKQLTQLNESQYILKIDLIEKISKIIINELKNRVWSDGLTDYLLDHAKIVMKNIEDKKIADMNIFIGED